jgi:antitoxin VapB
MAFTKALVYTYGIYEEITMVSSKLFLNNTTQAVRLPKEVAFPEGVTEVEIFVEGDTRVIVPKGQSLLAWMTTGPGFSDDFMVDRDQPSMPADKMGMFD